MNIPDIAVDKLKHFFWGAVAALAGMAGAATAAYFGPTWPIPAGGALGCAAAALGREAWNVTHGGRWSWADILATVLGGATLVGGFLWGSIWP